MTDEPTWRERMLLEALQDVLDRKGDWLGKARATLRIVHGGAAQEPTDGE